MPLDDLVEVIETLQQRIRDHGDSLRQNEIRTRVALIDPLLTALGWDVSNPGFVAAEYDVNGKRADYALLDGQGNPVVFLEAKRLDEPLSNHRSQVVAYASELGIRYPALTNGKEWEVYDNSKLVPIDQRLILNASVSSNSSAASALQFLLLWRPSLATGRAITANEPLFDFETSTKPESDSPIVDPQLMPANDVRWTRLTELSNPQGTRRPTGLRLPTNEERVITNWSMLFSQVAEWLIDINKLSPNQCPIKFRHRQRYLVHTDRRHPSGKVFRRSHGLSNGLYCELNWKADEIVDAASFLIQQFDQDPAAVFVKVG
ncbi:MAG: type I restriction enzyme HsdR N-terminal domain-containing protein [Chloroflexi bacterium]|nr:type I restriction enzyme HsdR N-terminal domain-containing protein [Chloroflexota bacterium]